VILTNKIKTKAVLFDLVDTLIYTKDPVGYVYSNVARSFGFETDYKKLDKAFEEIAQKFSPPVGGEIEEKKWWRNVVFNTFKMCECELGNKFEEIFEILFKEFTRKSAWAVYPDVLPMLCELSVGTNGRLPQQIGLVSNFDSRVETILKGLDLFKYFSCLSYSGKVGFSKPDLRIFQFALEELNILPEEAIYVGDSLNIDYYPACDMNIRALLIDRDKKALIKDIKTISSLSEIFDFIV